MGRGTLYAGQVRHEMCDFGPDGLSSGRSPGRLDALVWAITALMLREEGEPRVSGMCPTSHQRIAVATVRTFVAPVQEGARHVRLERRPSRRGRRHSNGA